MAWGGRGDDAICRLGTSSPPPLLQGQPIDQERQEGKHRATATRTHCSVITWLTAFMGRAPCGGRLRGTQRRPAITNGGGGGGQGIVLSPWVFSPPGQRPYTRALVRDDLVSTTTRHHSRLGSKSSTDIRAMTLHGSSFTPRTGPAYLKAMFFLHERLCCCAGRPYFPIPPLTVSRPPPPADRPEPWSRSSHHPPLARQRTEEMFSTRVSQDQQEKEKTTYEARGPMAACRPSARSGGGREEERSPLSVLPLLVPQDRATPTIIRSGRIR